MKKLTLIIAAIALLVSGCGNKDASTSSASNGTNENTKEATTMNTTMQDLLTRRSVRSYTDEVPPREVIEEICKAGTYAPTGMNRQAPVVLVVLADTTAAMTWKEDGSLVMGNLLNAAHAKGLGSCWIHRAKEVFATDEGKAILAGLGIDTEKYVGIGNCILGYVNGDYPEAKPRKENYVYWIE